MAMQPAQLGELQPPQGGFSPKNRHARGGLRGSKGQHLRELREKKKKERKKKKKEEERKPRRYRITTVIILYVISCSVFFMRQSLSFVFKDLM